MWGSRLVFIAAAVGVILWVLFQLRVAVVPVLIALLLSTLVAPIAGLLRRAKIPAALASALALLFCLAALGGLGALVARAVSGEVQELGSSAARGYRHVAENIAARLGVPTSEISGWVDSQLSNLRSNGVATTALRQVRSFLEGLTVIALSVVFTFLFCWDGEKQFKKLVGYLRSDQRPAAAELGRRIWETIGGYMRGMFVIAAVDATLLGIGFRLIGMPLIFPLMLLMFLGALVPFFGPIVAATVAALVALAEGSPTMAALAVGVAFIVQQIEGNLLHPLIMGKAVALHPTVILFAVTAGGVLGGIVGIFLAVPIAAALATTLAFAREEGHPQSPSADKAELGGAEIGGAESGGELAESSHG